MKLPKEPTFLEVLNAKNADLYEIEELRAAHELRRIIVEGAQYIKLCEEDKIIPKTSELGRFSCALSQFKQLMEKHGWTDDTLIHELA